MNLLHNACEANLVDGTIRITTQNRYFDKPNDFYEQIEGSDYDPGDGRV